jgi:hypothetical protein
MQSYIGLIQKRANYVIKAIKRLKKYYDLEKATKDAIDTFGKMLNGSEAFQKLVFDSLSGQDWDRWFNPVVFEKVLKDSQLRKNTKLVSFLLSLHRLDVEYDSQIEIIKKDEGEIEFYPIYGRLPDRFLVSMKGMEAKLESRDSYDQDFIESSPQIGSFFDETEINDLTTDEDYEKRLDNPLVTYLINTSEVIPSIVKYTRKETGYKKLFISLPAGTSVATFLKEHGTIVSKIHNDFYQRAYKGRQESRSDMESQIRMAMEEYRGREGSLSKLSELVSKKVDRAPSTIKRHYKRVLKEVKGTKNRR